MEKITKESAKIPKKSAERQPSPFFLALVLTGILALEMYPTLVDTANANAVALKLSDLQTKIQDRFADPTSSQAVVIPIETQSGFSRTPVFVTQQRSQTQLPATLLSNAPILANSAKGGPNRPAQLPTPIGTVVRQEISRQTGIAAQQLKITEFSRQNWPDSCLGLPKSGEFCGQAIVEGWRVVVSDGRQTWVYRTDGRGRVLRQEDRRGAIDVPPKVGTAVLQEAAQQSGLATSTWQIVEAKQQTWPDGCLGLADLESVCTMALVPGWQVTAVNGDRRWVYRTNASGSVVKLDRAASQIAVGGSAPVKIPAAELPPPLTQGMLFRAIASGGIAGRTYETVLMKDGRLLRVPTGSGNTNDAGRQVYQVSPQQVRQFQTLLQRLQLSRFNGLCYPAPPGSADFITVTLTSEAGTVQYADFTFDRLPQPLREAIGAWNQMTRVIQAR